MREIGHFIGGKEVKGASGRFGDVFDPNTGEVQAKVAFAKRSEVEQAIANAEAAQPAWATVNPQRRARVSCSSFSNSCRREFDSSPGCSRPSTARPFADAKGDMQRGLEVVEFACGIPHLIKGEFTEGAGPGIDLYSMRQPLGVVAGITPFNFPAMIPMWKFAPALACGNAFILKPSERDPSRADAACRTAAGSRTAGRRAQRRQRRQGSGRYAADDPRIRAIGFVGSSAIAEYIYATGCAQRTSACNASAAPRTT